MIKVLLIQPPQWYPVSPFLAVPLLKGQLKSAGIDAKACDLNVDFYNRILCSDEVKKADLKAREMLTNLSGRYDGNDINPDNNSASYENITLNLKYQTIFQFYTQHGSETEYIIKNIDDAVHILKSEDDFYKPEKLFEAKHIINTALRIISLPFAPCELAFDNYFTHPLLNLDWINIKKQCEDSSVNIFYDYYDRIIEKLSLNDYHLIGISMTDLSQLVSVFTLASMIKRNCGAHVVLGGNYATQIHEDIIKHNEILSDYFDSILIGDGEYSIVKLSEHIDGKCAIGDVPNLVYRSVEGKIINTGFNCQKIDMNSLQYADFSDYNMADYFIPNPTFPIQISKGCYWGKCKFCDYYYGQQGYSSKTVGRVISELKYYIEKYNASKFIFVDEAIPAALYNEIALAIIKNGLNINFYSFARLETDFTQEIFKNLYNAGARMFLWGYENYSTRIMKMMNKGIHIEERLDILKRSRDAGIWNNGLFIFGYPTETEEEIQETMEFIRNNRVIIPSCTLSNFALKKHSRLKEMIGEDGIRGYSENGEFYTVLKDDIDGVRQSDRRTLRRKFQQEFLNENAYSLWPVIFSDFDHLLLYLSKFGCDAVNEYRSNTRICPEFR